MLKPIARRLSRSRFVQRAVAEGADLTVFGERPSPRVITGLGIIGLSYLIGWPAIAGLGLLATHLKQPLLLAVGGPLMYGLSHLTFMVGAYFAGAVYARNFLRWVARVGVERLLGPEAALPGPPETRPGGGKLTDRRSC